MVRTNLTAKRLVVLLGVLMLTLGFLAGCGGTSSSSDRIRVGSKDFTEQLILGQITLLALEDAGFEVEDRTNVAGSEQVRSALLNSEIDVYWEYTGTGWLMHLQNDEAITNPQEAYDRVKEADLENEIVWLDYAPFNNTYTIMMNRDQSEELGIRTISDMADYVNQNPGSFSFGADHEFTARPDGLPALEDEYGFELEGDSLKVMDIGIVYRTLRDRQVDSGMGFATDGRIEAFDFVNLEDDKQFFPVYNPSALLRTDTLEEHPELADVLNRLAAELDNESMIMMNYQVDIEEMEPREVAENWLKEKGLIE
ncbi:osmoprotectant transport system substrate-binding protein [Acetoanaerobium pronyense]|uniref:Osmoprotectant transport system substrate-binding protein n=1 Tax=Acetoanaerobium pronyense TaxID=1482736 RepID=A0ABS4KM97_9FIRM|nr:glycine betaine ABC transporter substrate-binding protein [Acetoanaerobium pronyense]MBP2028276.1 osmoprotectant transport system substrate-binding protein [Acetoanaerobium pronyense]